MVPLFRSMQRLATQLQFCKGLLHEKGVGVSSWGACQAFAQTLNDMGRFSIVPRALTNWPGRNALNTGRVSRIIWPGPTQCKAYMCVRRGPAQSATACETTSLVLIRLLAKWQTMLATTWLSCCSTPRQGIMSPLSSGGALSAARPQFNGQGACLSCFCAFCCML